MEWDTFEHTYTEKTNDWYASAIIIAGALIAVEFIVNNFLLITLTVIATAAFIMMAARKPNMVHVEIRNNGIRVGDTLYPYQSLDGFAIIDYTPDRRLLIESTKRLMPIIVIHLPDELDHEALHAELLDRLPERELHESIPQLLLEKIGF